MSPLVSVSLHVSASCFICSLSSVFFMFREVKETCAVGFFLCEHLNLESDYYYNYFNYYTQSSALSSVWNSAQLWDRLSGSCCGTEDFGYQSWSDTSPHNSRSSLCGPAPLCFLHRVFPKMKSKLEKAMLLRDISGWFAVTTGITPDVRDEKDSMDRFDNGSEIRAG